MMGIKILLIDDSKAQQDTIKALLESELYEQEPFEIITAVDNAEGLAKLAKEKPDLILLDVDMPRSKYDGWVTCLQIRRKTGYEHGTRGIIMFSARRRELVDIETGYYAGADSYLVTPLDRRKLVAEIQSVLRKINFRTPPNADEEGVPEGYEEFGTFMINRAIRSVFVDGEEVKLTAYEFNLLDYLHNHRNQLCTYKELIDYVWYGIDWNKHDNEDIKIEETEYVMYASNESLRKIMSGLRKKLKDDDKTLIVNRRNEGYYCII